jgi:hypothetical protein
MKYSEIINKKNPSTAIASVGCFTILDMMKDS